MLERLAAPKPRAGDEIESGVARTRRLLDVNGMDNRS